MHRAPQFFFPTPPGFKDEPFVLPISFAQNINITLAPGEQYRSYVIRMDSDYDQYIRSIFWQGTQQGQGPKDLGYGLKVKLIVAFGYDFPAGLIPCGCYFSVQV